ncbi:hypothetical protein [Neptuniibacter sp. QD37_11]|uniref:hypothetical protein n=1 Tax=Neptuniibacter sp. QD37_11 TaxID=3398209 RepID=UPI0039F5E307
MQDNNISVQLTLIPPLTSGKAEPSLLYCNFNNDRQMAAFVTGLRRGIKKRPKRHPNMIDWSHPERLAFYKGYDLSDGFTDARIKDFTADDYKQCEILMTDNLDAPVVMPRLSIEEIERRIAELGKNQKVEFLLSYIKQHQLPPEFLQDDLGRHVDLRILPLCESYHSPH